MTQNWFDDVSKALANAGSRRSFLRGLGIAVGGLAIGAFRSSPAWADSGCQQYCKSKGYHGKAFGDCMESCNNGIGMGTCESDSDCFHTGCSGQVCASHDVITTCEYSCIYGCYALAPCECIGNGCGFRNSRELNECIAACADQGEVCGNVVCPEGEVCCNASCSICTPPGGVCIQIVCEP